MPKLLDPDDMPAWIARLWPKNGRVRNIITGINEDDCAVIKFIDQYLVITTDFLNASPIALQLKIGNLWNLGRLLVASNLSDLCGSGAKPIALLIGITLPHGATEADFKNIMKGIKYEADKYRIPVVGGDSKLGKSRALVGVAIGSATSQKCLFLKNRAKPGDIVWVSGDVGSAAAAVWGYCREHSSKTWRNWAKRALLEPNIPLSKSMVVASKKIGRGGTDVSDGLGNDIAELCEASGVGVIIDAESIPLNKNVYITASAAGVAPWMFAFASGGDFQFIVTTSKKDRTDMSGLKFTEIGVVTKSRNILLKLPTGITRPLPIKGHRDSRGLSFKDEIDLLIRG